MENIFKVYDVYDNNYKLNSQVIFNNIGFEIPDSYYFDKNETNINENKFKITNNKNEIYIYCSIITDDTFNCMINTLDNKKHEFYQNYREQKIYEFNENGIIKIIGYIDNVYVEAYCKCKKYSEEYFELHYIVFSANKLQETNYDNLELQRNNYCILKNGKFIFEKYSINLNHKRPYEFLKQINNKDFINYLTKHNVYNLEIINPYLKNNYNIVFNKIQNYWVKKEDDDKDPMDIVVYEENEVLGNE